MFERKTLKDDSTTKDSQKMYIIIVNVLNKREFGISDLQDHWTSSAWVLSYISHNIITCIQRPPKID